jgi:hypothetical protein
MTPKQVHLFIQIMQDECTIVPKTAVRYNIPRQKAYTPLREFNTSNNSALLGFHPESEIRGTKQKLFPRHIFFFQPSTYFSSVKARNN